MEKITNLSEQQILDNKNEFLQLLSKIQIQNADTAGLANYLLNSDFFEAPASTKYHCNFKGGLCLHSLNVYKNLKHLYESYKDLIDLKIDEDSLLICGLFHDISKTNFYEVSIGNKKVYSDQGSKHDNMGKFDWVSVESYKVRDPENRFIAGTHEENSVLILSRFIPLNQDETVAIMNHHMHTGDGIQFMDQTYICNQYPLAVLLHIADFMSSFIMEGTAK